MAWNDEKIENNCSQQKQITANNAKPVICVCIPHQTNVAVEWVETCYVPLKYKAEPDFDKTMLMSRGAPLDTTRNQMVKDALAMKNVTHILFVDSDMLPESPADINQSIRQLLSLNAPIASGLYRAKQAHGNPYAMWLDTPDRLHYAPVEKWTGNWIPVDVVGFGFILIKREVFEHTPEPWFKWDTIAPSEDFYFCRNAKEAGGFQTRVFTDVRFSHAGQMKVFTNGDVKALVM